MTGSCLFRDKGHRFIEQVMRPSVSHSCVVIRVLAGVHGHRYP